MFKEFTAFMEYYSNAFLVFNDFERLFPNCIDQAFTIFENGLDPFQFAVYYSVHDVERIRMFVEVMSLDYRDNKLTLKRKNARSRVERFVWENNEWVPVRRNEE